MILVYTGDGKGKTSACAGQALRALGRGLEVAFGQFIKRDGQAGEQIMLRRLLGENFYAGGLGFVFGENRVEHREAALRALDWALRRLPHVRMLVLDEALYALGAELVLAEEIRALVDEARRCGTHLVLSGRGLPEWLAEEADLVTEMLERKHPWQEGQKAVLGIEF